MESFPSHGGYQVHRWCHGMWKAIGYDGTTWFEAADEDTLRSMIDAALDEIPEPVVPSGILK